MNRKIVLVLAAAAFVLAGCFNDEISTSIIWQRANPHGGISSYVEKTTTTKFVDDDPAKGVDQVVVEYFHYPLGFGSNVRLVVKPCDGGFCDDRGPSSSILQPIQTSRLPTKSSTRRTTARGVKLVEEVSLRLPMRRSRASMEAADTSVSAIP